MDWMKPGQRLVLGSQRRRFVRLPARSIVRPPRVMPLTRLHRAQFALIVAFAGCVPLGAPRTTPSERPIAVGLAIALEGKDVETLADGSTIIAGHGPDAFRIVATTQVGRHPYPGEVVKAVLTSGERVVKEVPFEFDAVKGRAHIDVAAAGTYRLEIWAQNTYITGNTFVAASLPAFDGKRSLELHQDASPQLVMKKQGPAEVQWQHWDSVDSDAAFVAEWWHDRKRVSSAGGKRSEMQRQVLAQVQNIETVQSLGNQPTWRWTAEKFPLPDDLLRSPGHWELRVYRDDEHAPLAFGFDVLQNGAIRGAHVKPVRGGNIELDVAQAPASKDATRELAKLPRTRFEGSKRSFLPVTAAEARALTRSEVLRSQRTRLNALSRQASANGGDPAMSFGTKQDTPQGAEAKKLVTAMQKLILQLGEPWTDDERP